MRMQAMVKTPKAPDPVDEIVRANLLRFREEAGMSAATAADVSGVSLDNLRRYESGTTATVPGVVLSALGKVYGHSVDDFFLQSPPPAKLDDRPVFFLRTRPGAQVDSKVYAELQEILERANRDARAKKPKK